MRERVSNDLWEWWAKSSCGDEARRRWRQLAGELTMEMLQLSTASSESFVEGCGYAWARLRLGYAWEVGSAASHKHACSL